MLTSQRPYNQHELTVWLRVEDVFRTTRDCHGRAGGPSTVRCMTPWPVLDAIGSFGALVFAVAVAVWSEVGRRKAAAELKETRERQEKTQRAHDAAARRSQAELVIAWFEHRVVDRRATLDGSDIVATRPFVFMVNNSEMPIFDVHIVAVATVSNAQIEAERTPVVPAGTGVHKYPVPESHAPTVDDEMAVVMTFRDLAGVRWERTQDGALREVP